MFQTINMMKLFIYQRMYEGHNFFDMNTAMDLQEHLLYLTETSTTYGQ